MELYLFRHGIAEEGAPGQSDAKRALTDEGRKKTAEVVAAARRAGVEPSLIISSPYVRAVETAQIAVEGFGCKAGIIRTETLVPFGSPDKVWAELRGYSGEAAILMAGHEPLLSSLACLPSGEPGTASGNEEGGDGAHRCREPGSGSRTAFCGGSITPKFCQ